MLKERVAYIYNKVLRNRVIAWHEKRHHHCMGSTNKNKLAIIYSTVTYVVSSLCGRGDAGAPIWPRSPDLRRTGCDIVSSGLKDKGPFIMHVTLPRAFFWYILSVFIYLHYIYNTYYVFFTIIQLNKYSDCYTTLPIYVSSRHTSGLFMGNLIS